MKTGQTRALATASLVAALALPHVVPAAPTIANYTWQAKDGSWDGSFDDSGHWDRGAVPVASNMAVVGVSKSATVTLPAGNYDTLASLRFNIAGNGTLTWDGSQTAFRQVTSEADNYSDEPFGFRYYGSHFLNLQTYSDPSGVRYRSGLSAITNGVFRLTKPSSDAPRVKVDFDSGSYNFYDAGGTACPTRYFFCGNSGIGGNVEVN